MSTILKALRRLEEQKSSATPRPLRDEVVLVPARRRSRSGVVVAVIAAVAFALLGGTLMWLLNRTLEEPAEPIAATTSAIDVAAPPTSVSIAAAEAEQVTAVTVASPDPIATASQAPTVPVPTAPADFAVVHPHAQTRGAPAAEPVAEPPAVEYDEVAVARPSAAPRLPETERGFVDESIPAARVTRPRSPVRVERTQWHPSPERRIAWVEVEGVTALREVREGERIGSYTVREIEPAAVLFADGSVELRTEVGR